jgi:hypothetical protein
MLVAIALLPGFRLMLGLVRPTPVPDRRGEHSDVLLPPYF